MQMLLHANFLFTSLLVDSFHYLLCIPASRGAARYQAMTIALSNYMPDSFPYRGESRHTKTNFYYMHFRIDISLHHQQSVRKQFRPGRFTQRVKHSPLADVFFLQAFLRS